jgi:hypothetical protein
LLQTSYNLKYNQASNLQRHQAEDYLKTKNIQKALEEMQLQEEEVKLLHEREQKDKEEDARRRKEEGEHQIKDKIMSANRWIFVSQFRLLKTPFIRKKGEKEAQEKNEKVRNFVQTESEQNENNFRKQTWKSFIGSWTAERREKKEDLWVRIIHLWTLIYPVLF